MPRNTWNRPFRGLWWLMPGKKKERGRREDPRPETFVYENNATSQTSLPLYFLFRIFCPVETNSIGLRLSSSSPVERGKRWKKEEGQDFNSSFSFFFPVANRRLDPFTYSRSKLQNNGVTPVKTVCNDSCCRIFCWCLSQGAANWSRLVTNRHLLPQADWGTDRLSCGEMGEK